VTAQPDVVRSETPADASEPGRGVPPFRYTAPLAGGRAEEARTYELAILTVVRDDGDGDTSDNTPQSPHGSLLS